MNVKRVIDDYINGNLTDAKAGAKKVSGVRLVNALIEDYGKTPQVAFAITNYLKGLGTFQRACEAEGVSGESHDL